MKYLITGGLGFIGQELARQVNAAGHEALIVDNLSPQVHRWGDTAYHGTRIKICDFSEVMHYLDFIEECDHLVHLAAETGTGQSMYEVERYTYQNVQKFAVLLGYLAKNSPPKLKSVSLSSSRSIYGEGAYICTEHGRIQSPEREIDTILAQDYEPHCPVCGASLVVTSTMEADRANPLSVYATTKLTQEFLLKNFSQMTGIPASIFRYQNVFGEGQSLSNPYTGILAIFSNLARANKTIKVFEDGRESRDFVHVSDVCRAMLRVMGQHPSGIILNIGTGIGTNVLQVAEGVKSYFGSTSEIVITHQFRKGDIRHNIADLTLLGDYIDTSTFIGFSEGLERFLVWASGEEQGSTDDFAKSLNELSANGLLVEK